MDDKFLEFVQGLMIDEAKKIEETILRDEELADVAVPDKMYEEIMERLNKIHKEKSPSS